VAQADLVVAARALLRAVVGREDDERTARCGHNVCAALRARSLLHEHELAALVVDARLREHRQHLEREGDVAVEILVERVPIARSVAQDQRRRPLLTRGAATLEQLRMLERIGGAVAAEQGRPVIRNGREVPVERSAQLGDRVRQRVVEVAIAAVAEAMAGHVDRRAEAPAVEQIRQRRAFTVAQERVADGEAALAELAAQILPVQRVDAPGGGDCRGAHVVPSSPCSRSRLRPSNTLRLAASSLVPMTSAISRCERSAR